MCKAINIAGQDDKNFHLNVYGEHTLLYLLLFLYNNTIDAVE